MQPVDWRDLPPLPALRAFEAAARLGSFSAAARSLNVTPPAVAQQVRGLERHLGLRLVADASRKLRLTDEGDRLAATLNSAFAGVAMAITSSRKADQRRGLRITLTTGFAHSVVIPALPEFWATHPDIPVSLEPETRLADLATEGFDLGIRTGAGNWPDLRAEMLCTSRMVLVGAPALLDRGRPLAELPWILNSAYRDETVWLAGHGIDPDRVKVIEFENAALACAAAEQGLGLQFGADIIVRKAVEAGRLRVLPGWDDLPQTTYWAVMPPGGLRAPAAIFLDWLRKRLPKETLA